MLWNLKFQRKDASVRGPSFLFIYFFSNQLKDAVGKKEIVENDRKDFYVCLNILHIRVGGNNLVFFSDAKSVIQFQSQSVFFYKDNSKNSGLKFYMLSLVGKII